MSITTIFYSYALNRILMCGVISTSGNDGQCGLLHDDCLLEFCEADAANLTGGVLRKPQLRDCVFRSCEMVL